MSASRKQHGIDLRPLETSALAELLQAAYELSPEDQETLVQMIIERAGGNPLYVHELLRTIEHQGALQRDAIGWTLGDLGTIDVPPLIQQLVETRLVGVSDETRHALDIAAVIGQEFPFELWEAIVRPNSGLLTAVREATAARILEEAAGGQSMRFHHELFRQAIYGNLLLPQRRTMHLRIAETLMTEGNPEPDVVAHHLDRAGDERTVDWLILAGGRAERLYAPLMAIDAYERALAGLETSPARDRERGWLMHRIARLYRWHDPQRSLPYLRRARNIGREIGDDTLEAYAGFDYGVLLRFTGSLSEGLDAMRAGVSAIDRLPPGERKRSSASISPLFEEAIPGSLEAGHSGTPMPGLAPGVNLRKQTLAQHLASAGHFDEAERVAGSLFDELHNAGLDRDWILALTADANRALVMVHAARGSPEQAAYYSQLARESAASRDDHLWVAATALLELAIVNQVFEPNDTATRRYLESTISSVLRSEPQTRAWVDDTQAPEMYVAFLNGQWEVARTIALAYLNDDPPRPPVAEQTRALSLLATIAQRQGKAGEALQWIERLFPRGPGAIPEVPIFFIHEPAHRVAIEIALDQGDPEAAATWLDIHDAWLESTACVIGQPQTNLLRARIALLGGKIDAAREQAAKALERASNPRQPLALVTIDRFVGELELQQGNLDEARTHLERSLELAERCENPYELLASQVSYAGLLVTIGEHAAVRNILNEALPKLEQLETAPLITRLKEIQRKLDRTTTRDAHPAGLSDREVEVLEQAATGMTNAEIGETLFISPRTVAQHLRSVYNKLGVNSRAAAVARWAELGGRRE